MVQELFDQNVFAYIMLALCAFGILLKLMLDLVYSRLIKASDNMATSKNKLTQTMKKKFETCYKLKIGVNNVDIFVDKYVFRHRFCGILLSTWENICGQVLILCLLVGSISTILGLIYECGKQQILGTFSVGILTSGLLIFLEGLINLSGKRELIRLNMKDYLENILKVRLEQEMVQPEFIEQYKKEYLNEDGGSAFTTSVLAATVEKTKKELRKERKDKLVNIKADKIRVKKERKEATRIEKINRKAAAKAEIKKKKDDKKFDKLNSQKQKELKRIHAKEEEERIKKETKLALERKRELERAEIERIKAEVKAEEDKKKDEKRRQEEIKKALLLERQIAKEEKHKPQTEYKTIAQERKENLLKEIKERRSVEVRDPNKADEKQENHGDKIAATVMDVNLQVHKPFAEKAHVEKVQVQIPHLEKPHVEVAQVAPVEKAVIDKKEIEKPQLTRVNNMQAQNQQNEKAAVGKVYIERSKNENQRTEKAHIELKHQKEQDIKQEIEQADAKESEVKENSKKTLDQNSGEKEAVKPTQKVKPANGRKSRQAASSDEKLIEDILKEFLA